MKYFCCIIQSFSSSETYHHDYICHIKISSVHNVSFILDDYSQVEEYGTCTAVLEPYFAVIQAGDLQPYFNINTDRKRLIYSVNTVKIRLQYGCKSPAWITEKYGSNTVVYVQNTVEKRPFTVRLRSFTEHRKPPLGFFFFSYYCELSSFSVA